MRQRRHNDWSFSDRVKDLPDPYLIISVLILVASSLVIIYSASSTKAHALHQNSAFYFNRQLMKVALGIIGMLILSRFNYRKLRFFGIPLLAVSIGALISLLIPGGVEPLNGARRALDIGGRSLQPAELAKFALIIYLADSISRNEGCVRTWPGYLKRLALGGGIGALIVFQPDFSNGALISLIGVAVLYLAGAKSGYLFITGVTAIPAFYFTALSETYRVERMNEFIEGILHPERVGYQVGQSLIGLGDGGLFGVGIGMSHQKQFFLPEPFTDFVFSILGEELGFIGSSATVLIFTLIALRGLKIARNAPDHFGYLLAGGITVAISSYAFVNLLVVTGLLPATGLPLPFLTYGGSSLVITMMMVGVLLNISRQSAEIASSNEAYKRGRD